MMNLQFKICVTGLTLYQLSQKSAPSLIHLAKDYLPHLSQTKFKTTFSPPHQGTYLKAVCTKTNPAISTTKITWISSLHRWFGCLCGEPIAKFFTYIALECTTVGVIPIAGCRRTSVGTDTGTFAVIC